MDTPAVIQELTRRFEAIKHEPRSFYFWQTVSDYAEFVRAVPILKKYMEDSYAKYSEAQGTIVDASYARELAIYGIKREDYESDDEYQHHLGHYKYHSDLGMLSKEKMNALNENIKFRAIEIGKIESVNAGCRFVVPKMILDVFDELANKHRNHEEVKGYSRATGYHKDLVDELATDGVRFEKEIDEIRTGKISRDNPLVRRSSSIYGDVAFVHRELVNFLSVQKFEKPPATESSNDDVKTAEPEPQSHVQPEPPAAQPEQQPVEQRLEFDSEESLLHLHGFKIKIKRRVGDNYGHEILSHVFKTGVGESYPFRDIAEDALKVQDYSEDKEKFASRCRRACEEINRKVMEGTNYEIRDFLEFGSGITSEVKINKKYL